MRAAYILTLALTFSACGGARPAPIEAHRQEEPPVEVAEPAPSTAIEFVRLLEAIATGARPGSLEEHVDQAFAGRLPSGDDLAGLFRYSDDCTPELSDGPGYGAVAIPPPMDEPPEEAARIEAIIAELQASTEVFASCRVMEEIDGEMVPQELNLYAIAVRQGADGRWRAMAWRDFRNEDPMRH